MGGGISGHQLINRYFTKAREEIARIIGTSLEGVDLSEPIDLTALPLGKRRAVEAVYQRLGAELSLLLPSSIGNAWQSTTATQERRTPFRLTQDERASINSHNLEALKAFKSREVGGLTLSSRIWQYVGQEKAMMEACLTRVIRERRAPEDVRRLFIKYLNLPEEMKRYIAGERNPQKRQEAMRAFTAGRGVYLDPLKNIERLLRTEINRATKTADYEWMQRNPYIIGYRIKRSQRHKETPCEACDKLQGEYPKTFKFVGWHPNCSCIVEPIFAKGDERKQIRREISQALKDGRQPASVQAPSHIDELPPAFSQHYARYQAHGTIPRVLDEALAPYHEQLNQQIQLQYPKEQWEHTYTNPTNGGYVVTDKQRIREGQRNSNEREIFDKEASICKVLANLGHKIQHLPGEDREPNQTFDVLLDGIPTELKSFRGSGAMVRQIKHALEEQGAVLVVVRLENDSNKLLDKLIEARRKFEGRILYYRQSEGKVYELHK